MTGGHATTKRERIVAPRIIIKKLAPEAYQHLYALDNFLTESRLDPALWELVKIRASQINGCAFCVNMHSFAAHQAGESLERLFAVAVWREAPFFTDPERAALALTEAATVFEHGQVSDEVWGEAATHFDEDQLAALVLAIGLINLWNRIGVTTRMVAG
ncbi:MAG: alkylhydroperoxidase [Pseudonocardiales bacterium]|nr:MAG: alkylhydroperoxidase [Pseudonocardiales bacterium]